MYEHVGDVCLNCFQNLSLPVSFTRPHLFVLLTTTNHVKFSVGEEASKL